MINNPDIKPTARLKTTLHSFLLRRLEKAIVATVAIVKGVVSNFKCSNTLSLTGENQETNGFC